MTTATCGDSSEVITLTTPSRKNSKPTASTTTRNTPTPDPNPEPETCGASSAAKSLHYEILPDPEVKQFKDHIPPPVLLRADGTRQPLPPANGKTFTLAELQGAVGGDIELVYLGDDLVMVVNENGKLLNLAQNELATWTAQPGLYLFLDDVIVGDAVVAPDYMLS